MNAMADMVQAQSVTGAASDPLLAEIVSRLVAIYHPERIYLFGSRAVWDIDKVSQRPLQESVFGRKSCANVFSWSARLD